MKNLALICLSLAVLVVSGFSQEEPSGNLLDVLLQNGTITQKQYEALKKNTSRESKADPASGLDHNLDLDGGLKVSTYDGKFAFEVGGRLFVDTAMYKENLNSLGNGTEIRSARLKLEGAVNFDWEYELEFEFCRAEVNIADAYIDYRGWNNVSLKFGQFKPSFSLEQAGSRNHTTFMERALINEFVPDRRIGAQGKYSGNSWTASAGFFGEHYLTNPGDEGDEGWTTVGRFTYVPVHSDTKVLHFGASAAYTVPDDEKKIKFKRYPESHLTEVAYLNTGSIKDIDDIENYGIETAFVSGPLSLQGEYIHNIIRREEGETDLDFYGAYAFASWMITGESRNYKFKSGSFGRITPHSSYGAFEVAARYSMMDLNDFDTVTGGRESIVTFGVNWYANRNIRLMFNYSHINNDNTADDNEDVEGNDDIHVFQSRLQISF